MVGALDGEVEGVDVEGDLLGFEVDGVAEGP